MVIGFTQGTFDLFHIGHLNLIRNAAEQCDYLIVGVNCDSLVREYKNHDPVISEDNRLEIVSAIKYVDKAVLTTSLDKVAAYNEYKFDKLFIGDDWRGNPRWEKTKEDLEALGVQFVWLPYTKDISTTALREKIQNNKNHQE